MDLNCAKGDRVVLTDNCSQTFSGIVKSLNIDLGRIVLSNIYQLPEKKPVSGYRHFTKNEIVNFRKSKSNGEKVAGNPTRIEKTSKEPRYKLPLSEPGLDQIQKKLPVEYNFINNRDTNFYSAISFLKTCPKIGVSGRNVSKGRFERASVLAISTPSKVFVFDVLTLGDEVLQKNLKEVLESPNSIKVVHDCRLLSDCLKHKHLIELGNVRDIEAEDIMVVFQDRRMLRKHSRSLEYLSKVYLGVEIEESNDSGQVWNERPLPENLIEGFASQTSILLPLQEAIERKYLQKLVDASNIYNTHIKNSDFYDVLNDDPKMTLRKQMKKLVVAQTQTRNEFRKKKIS